MSCNRGFSLIELVVVIVILGLLAVTAAPRFLNFQSDARIATLDSFASYLTSANDMVQMKAEVTGVANEQGPVVVPGTDIQIQFGALVLTTDNINHAMTIDGYHLANIGLDASPILVVYTGKEKPLGDVRGSMCFLTASRSFIADSTGTVTALSEINISKYYQGC